MADDSRDRPEDRIKKHLQRSRRKAELSQASDVLQSLLQNSKSELADGFNRWRLEQQWPEIVGKTIAEQTVPAALEHGTLYIWVRHSVWMQQLSFFQDEILAKVNAHFQAERVRKIRFTLDRRAAQPPSSQQPPQR